MKLLRHLFYTLLLLLSSIPAMAESISPEQALKAAQTALASKNKTVSDGGSQNKTVYDRGSHRMVNTLCQPMKLAFTLKHAESPMVYVFTPEGDAPGFLITSADDTAMPVLGYSAESRFDALNMPPQMQWLLESYRHAIASFAQGTPSASLLQTNSVAARRLRSRAATREAIEPLCQTRWDQSAPYWNLTPMLDGGHAYTGCFATAVAQCMRVHRWPETGTGQFSYQFKYRNNTYEDSFDFGATTFDWDNMLDSYSGSYSDAQAAAVATLMHACGVAAQMSYGTWVSGGSNAAQLNGAQGLINYLGYDKGLMSLNRNWFSTEEWDQMMYDELAAGRPVPYGGQSGAVGHEFVCDGYSADGFFHINWGWSGMSDGYFALSELNPAEQGAGGTSSDEGYNKSQNGFFHMRAPGSNPSASYVFMMAADDFKTADAEYTRTSSTEIPLGGRFYNASLVELENVTIGFRVENGTKTTYVVGKTATSLLPTNGYSTIRVPTSSFPVGTCTVSPVFKLGDGEWQDFLYDRTKCAGYLTLTVTNNKIQVTKPEAPDAPIDKQMKVELLGYTPATPKIYMGLTYDFTYRFTAAYPDQAWFLQALTDINFKRKAFIFNQVTFTEPGEQTMNFTLTIPEDLEPEEYNIFLSREDASGGFVILGHTLLVKEVEPVPTAAPSLRLDIEREGAEYFDLSGRRLRRPAGHGLLIERNALTGAVRKTLR